MIEFEIDGKPIKAEDGSMIIEAADAAGIYIPRFCYHKKLTIAANCRMCLVEVDKSRKPLPACATPVTSGMKVFTKSTLALEAQRSVMEFLLINHPLDCPICDQGGECELQDLSMGYGEGVSRYNQGKRSVYDEDLGPLVETFMTRCIQCTRCVRFCDEVAGMPELGRLDRGEHLKISTYVKHTLQSELSGNIIDLCPVGALTSKPFKYAARAWELNQYPAIAPHDCLGSNIYVHTKFQEYQGRRPVMRVVPRENESINEAWLADRDRFSYEAVNSKQRATKPLVKIKGKWQEVEWQYAFDMVADHFQAVDPKQIGALTSPSATLEEMYLLQKLMRGLGSNNIDHRLRQHDFTDQLSLSPNDFFNLSLAEIETCDAVLLLGTDLRREQPLANLRVRKAALNGAKIMAINAIDYELNYSLTTKMIQHVEDMPRVVAGIVKVLATSGTVTLSKEAMNLLTDVVPSEKEIALAEQLKQAEKPVILLGAVATNHPHAAWIRALIRLLSTVVSIKVGYFSEGANARGAWLAGAIPHRSAGGKWVEHPGLDAKAMFAEKLPVYLLLNVEPELDVAASEQALEALTQADFVVSLSAFKDGKQLDYANVILPIAAFTETSGTFVNVEGRWQSFAAATLALAESRPAWKVLRVLANHLKLEAFDFVSSDEIHAEIKSFVEKSAFTTVESPLPTRLPKANNTLMRLADWPMIRVDNLLRRAPALQATLANDVAAVRLCTHLADKLQVENGQMVAALQNKRKVILPVVIDDRIADGQVFIPAGLAETEGFGEAYAAIEIQKVDA